MAKIRDYLKNSYTKGEGVFTLFIIISLCFLCFDIKSLYLPHFKINNTLEFSWIRSLLEILSISLSILLFASLFIRKESIKRLIYKLLAFRFIRNNSIQRLISNKPINNYYVWRVIFSLSLAVISLGLAITSDAKMYQYQILYTITSISSFVLFYIYIFKSNLTRFINNYLQNSPYNFVRTIATDQEFFILAIILGIITLIALTLLMKSLPNEKLGTSILEISFTIIGGFFSVLIYFKIEEKTTSLSDYMNKFIKILHHSYPGDKIYIIAPTLFVGQEFNNRLHEKYKRSLFDKIGYVNFIIANLNFKELGFNQITNYIDEKESWRKEIIGYRSLNKDFTVDNTQITEKKNNAIISLENYQKIISKKLNGLISFHKIFVPIDKNSNSFIIEPNFDHHCKLISFYYELITKNNLYTSNKITFRHLNWLYYTQPEYTKSKVKKENINTKELLNDTTIKESSNFFAVANVTQGDYYIGQFKVTNNKVHEFHGTSFKNENIKDQMTTMLDSFIKEYMVK